MAQPFKADSKTIGEMLGQIDKPKLVIPPFQRGYSWEKKHIQAFWKDLDGFLTDKSEGTASKYFLGPIVILEKADCIEILDGQQRMATATILFAAIRDAANKMGTPAASKLAHAIQSNYIAKEDAGDHLGYCLELGTQDKLFFQSTVQCFPAEKVTAKLRSQRSIRDASKFIGDSVDLKLSLLDSVDGLDYLKKLRDAVRSDFILTCIPVEDERDAFRIFETLNDRGLRLSAPDLLLNLLMKQASEAERAEIRLHWDQMLQNMGNRNIKDFLRDMWVSKFGDLKNLDLFTALKEHIQKEKSGSLAFAKACAEECEKYRILIDADQKYLNKQNARYVRALTKSLGCDAALPLLLSAYPRLTASGFEQMLRILLVFVARYDIIATKDSSGMETLLYTLARDVRNIREGKKVEQGKDETECIGTVKQQLRDRSPDDATIRAALVSLTLSQDAAVYLLDRLANYMQSDTKEVDLGETSLEHIFPKKPSDEWVDVEELESLRWHIGNMTMLGERLNGESANKGFASKKTVYAKSELVMAKEMQRGTGNGSPPRSH